LDKQRRSLAATKDVVGFLWFGDKGLDLGRGVSFGVSQNIQPDVCHAWRDLVGPLLAFRRGA
jgi:hypothetical protein